MPKSNFVIRSVEKPRCYLCGSEGKYLYTDLTDRLYGAPGKWSMKKCRNTVCGLIWLDPMPVEEDIKLAYHSYYTHMDERENINLTSAKFFSKVLRKVLFKAAGLINKTRIQHGDMYLGEHPPGRLLEVGCGAGTFLDRMLKKGWEVEGVDIDPMAAQAARQIYGIPVRTGKIEEIDYDESSFDAVVLRHVIEHVYDPIRLLKECFRVIKPTGRLVLMTPNSNSYGHSRFTSNWRGLEPPRHLFIFNQSSLLNCGKKAGFTNMKIWTTRVNAASIYMASKEKVYFKSCNGNADLLLQKSIFGAIFFVVMEFLLYQYNPWIGEEMMLQIVK